MPTNILMPALSPTMEKGKLAKWLKKEGDVVKSGDVIAEIETDKATMEVEAVDEGTIAKLLIAAGTEDVPVNTPIAVLAGEGENAADVKGAAPAPAPAAKSTAAAPVAAPVAPKPAASPAPAAAVAPQPGAKLFASPLAKRLAREKGINLQTLTGSGPHGRVVARDLDGARAGAAPAAQPSTAMAAPAAIAGLGDDAVLRMYEQGSYKLVPHDGMRKIIAARLTQSKQTVPHFYLSMDVTLDKLMATREAINASAPLGDDKKPVWKLSVNDFIIKGMALALQRVPMANATWTEGGMLLHQYSDVGVAVAVEGGLFTPVIRRAESKTLSAISIEMKDLAARARKRRLKPEEYQGGTTAISNLGMFGIREFSAVINPPHGTILAVGAGEKRAVVVDDKVKIRTQMTVTLSCDHRAVDGALGAELLVAVKLLLEEPTLMLV
jgi:pyruvate dehydrogenase E2 component (dihydrolipoamide acetyltransferase)